MKPDATVYQTVATLTNTPLAWVREIGSPSRHRGRRSITICSSCPRLSQSREAGESEYQSDIEKFLVKRAGFQHSGVRTTG
jgi:hypothetical protein